MLRPNEKIYSSPAHPNICLCPYDSLKCFSFHFFSFTYNVVIPNIILTVTITTSSSIKTKIEWRMLYKMILNIPSNLKNYCKKYFPLANFLSPYNRNKGIFCLASLKLFYCYCMYVCMQIAIFVAS